MQVTVTCPLISVAVAGDHATTPVFAPGRVEPDKSDGQKMVGGVVCCTLTVKVQLALFPDGSAAVHVTSVVPYANEDDDGGLHALDAMVPLLSVAVAENEGVA